MHFTWSERQQDNACADQEPEVDIVLFPGGGTFNKLPGHRMFILTHHDDQKLFFWSVLCKHGAPVSPLQLSAEGAERGFPHFPCRAQERDGGQDDQQCITVNECINSFTAGEPIEACTVLVSPPGRR